MCSSEKVREKEGDRRRRIRIGRKRERDGNVLLDLLDISLLRPKCGYTGKHVHHQQNMCDTPRA